MITMSKEANVTLTGVLRTCDACSVAKIRCNAIKKRTESPAGTVGERIFIDTSGPFPVSLGKNRYWRGGVDDFSGKMFMEFGPSKDGMCDWVGSLLEKLKGRNTPCRYLRCDNAGEHVGLKSVCDSYGVILEYTPPYSPQFNGRIERRFPIITQKGMAMMYDAGFSKEFRQVIWAEAMQTASFLHDIFPNSGRKQSSYEIFFGKPCEWFPYLIEYGRIGVTATKKKKKKLEPPGTPMIMVGYALQHKPGSYRMYNPKTRKVVVCDNVTWSESKQWKATDDMKQLIDTNDQEVPGIDDVQPKHELKDGTPIVVDNELYDDDKSDVTPVDPPSRPTKVRRMVQELDTSYNDTSNFRVTGNTEVVPVQMVTRSQASTYMIQQEENCLYPRDPVTVYETKDEVGRVVQHNYHFCFNTAITSDPGEPKTYKQAKDSNEWKWWAKAIVSEINNFLKRKAWKFVPKSIAWSKGRRLIPTKHVFKKKIELDSTTGKEFIRFKDRIVTLGFMQIPGVDYTESFSPVVTDSGLKTLFANVLFYWDDGWICVSYDVEAAFLEPQMHDLEMYIEIPQGVKDLGFITEQEEKENCILLMNSMYGNVDAALRWILLKTEFLTSNEVGMTQSPADPCMFFKRDKQGKACLILAMTVDDCAVGGKEEQVEWLLKKIESKFTITRGGTLRKHLGVDYKWETNEENEPYIELRMDRKLDDIISSYENMKGECKIKKTPASPGTILQKNEGESVDIDGFRSMIGKIMFYATKVSPKILNATRELATHMANPNESHWKAIGHLVGYLKGTVGKPALILRQPKELRVVSFVDASYGNSAEGRRSVSGELHTIGGMISAYSSRTQKTLSMSSTESEYIAASSAAQEIMFQQTLLSEVNETVLPAAIFEDNDGAIFLSKNKQVSQRTKHIDIRYHFLRDFTDKGKESCGRGMMMKVKGAENYADIFTKNVDTNTFNHLGEEIDNGLMRFRLDYDKEIHQQLGGISRTLHFEVEDVSSNLDKWIRHVSERKREVNGVKQEIAEKDDVK